MKDVTTIIKNKRSTSDALVCVVLTSFNYSAYIIEALDSIKNQTMHGLDIVVIDDCSSDNSMKKIEEWFQHNGNRFNSFTLLHNAVNQGAARARNSALEHTRAPFVFMMDSDNILYPRCIEKSWKALDVSGCDFAYPILERFGNETRLISIAPWQPEVLYYGNYIDNMALFRRDIFEAVGGYTPLERKGPEDYELFVKIAAQGARGCHVPEILARYRVHGNSVMDTLNKEDPMIFVSYLREKYKSFFNRIRG